MSTFNQANVSEWITSHFRSQTACLIVLSINNGLREHIVLGAGIVP